MTFKLKLIDENRIISSGEIESFVFTADIFSLYSICDLTIKDIASQTFNIIKTGMEIDVIFEDENTPSQTYVNKMGVVSFTKVPGQQNSLTDYLKMTLFPLFFFTSAVFTAAYKGNVSTIVGKIYTQFFSKNLSLDSTITDDVSKIRYQIAEKSQEFLLRLLTYGIKDDLPVYIFTDGRNTLNLKGISDFQARDAKYTLRPSLVELTNNVPADSSNLEPIDLLDYKFVGHVGNSASLIVNYFTTEAFVSSRDFKTSLPFNTAEYNNVQASRKTSPKKFFKPWYLTPDDALTLSVKESFETGLMSFYLVCLCRGLLFENLQPGDSVKVFLPASPETGEVLGEGEYLIQKVEYIWKNNLGYTRLTLLQAKH